MRVLTCPTCEAVATKPFTFCPDCGAAWPAVEESSTRAPARGEWRELPLASAGRRVGAYAIDLLLVGVVQAFQVPGIGELLGLAGAAYMLLRDMNGASLGKLALGMRVMREDGSEAPVARRILRNLPLSLADLPILLPFPVLDVMITGVAVAVVSAIELVLLLSTQRRLGDRMAGTVVLSRETALAARAVRP